MQKGARKGNRKEEKTKEKTHRTRASDSMKTEPGDET